MQRNSNWDNKIIVKNDNEKGKRMGQFSEMLNVTPINQFSGGSPFYRQPIEWGHFSIDGNRCYHNNAEQLRYYKPPKTENNLNFDLKQGYDTCILKDEDLKERLNHLLTWVLINKKKFSLSHEKEQVAENNSLHTDFVTWRGHLTKMLCTPYENREPWKMAATRFKGTIYISEVETEKAKRDRVEQSPKHHEMCYWGHKFEDYLTEINKESKSTNIVVNTNEEFCSVVRTRLNGNSIVCGAEVDCCIKGDKSKPPSNYVELKTTRIMENYRQQENFVRYKLLKYWAQSFLVGIPRIVVGMRDDHGIVRGLTNYSTTSIPGICKQYTKKWDANIALNFLDAILNWLKRVVVIDNPDIVYMVEFNEPFNFISLEVCKEGSEKFLPDWYIADVNSFK